MGIELRCPECSAPVGRTRRSRTQVGRPFEECPRCRALVPRPRRSEWDLLSAGQRLAFVVERLGPALALGLVPALASYALGRRSGALDLRLVLALLVAGPLVLGLFPLANILHAVRRSRARMGDPMYLYRARLLEYGRRSGARSSSGASAGTQ